MSNEPRSRIWAVGLLVLAFGLWALAGCSRSLAMEHYQKLGAPMEPAAEAAPESPRAILASAGEEMREVPIGQRVIVYTAAFRIVVHDVFVAVQDTRRIAQEMGGYVQRIQGDAVTIRVPAERFQAAVERLEALGQVSHREVEATDVTDEYVDLQARLKNAQAVRERLLALLQKAEDVKAALEVEKELNRVGAEIEQLQAKIEVLKNRVAYSTITVTFERVAQQTHFRGVARLPFAWLRELDPNRLWQE